MKCRNCGGGLETFLDLGRIPLANHLLSAPDERYKRYPLGLAYCRSCFLVQNIHVVPPKELFSHYVYTTGSSKVHKKHFEELADQVMEEYEFESHNPLVVDIGSNDGTLLTPFKQGDMRVLGIEPAANIAKIATEAGIPTLNAYFNKRTVLHVLENYGSADIVTATNVVTHIDDLHAFLDAVQALLAPDGLFVVEVYDLVQMLKDTLFDLVYHEHLTYFTVRTLDEMMRKHGLHIERVVRVPTQGGSLRAFIRLGKPEAHILWAEPETIELVQMFRQFALNVELARRAFRRFVRRMRRDGQRIVGYSAPAKATTLLNYCKLTVRDVAYVVDDNPLKQNRWVPGTKIPIYDPGVLDVDDADIAIIFAWNLVTEIAPKLIARGMKGFVPLPVLTEVTT